MREPVKLPSLNPGNMVIALEMSTATDSRCTRNHAASVSNAAFDRAERYNQSRTMPSNSCLNPARLPTKRWIDASDCDGNLIHTLLGARGGTMCGITFAVGDAIVIRSIRKSAPAMVVFVDFPMG